MTWFPRLRHSTVSAAVILATSASMACGQADAAGHDGGPPDAGAIDRESPDSAAPDTGAGTDADVGGSPDGAMPGGFLLDSFVGGFDDHFTLPPRFSSLLPLTGEEVTREPPGFYDVTATTYFSYAFLWWVTGTPDLSTGALRDDLQIYYIGLCGTSQVTVTLQDPQSPQDARGAVDAGMLLARRDGMLAAETCFGHPVPTATLEVSTYQCPDHLAVLVLVRSQPPSSPVGADLVRIRDSFTCF
ncbi:MAG TPA: hypothetical protein VK540_07460 [Polyangiaceae bacterium]|nr:hypothetical protein [Polyangiaceae bacterium]